MNEFQSSRVALIRSARTVGLMTMLVLPPSMTIGVYREAGWAWWAGLNVIILGLGWWFAGRLLWRIQDWAIQEVEAEERARRVRNELDVQRALDEKVDVLGWARAEQAKRDRERERLERIAELRELREGLIDG